MRKTVARRQLIAQNSKFGGEFGRVSGSDSPAALEEIPLIDAATKLDQLCINTVRTLSMDAVQAANSGHPGTPMALAPLGWRLYTRHMRHDPRHPQWPDRDRFVLSCGHASMLLYSLLHLTGYDVTLDHLKNFRQLGSPTAGHPERGHLPGVETTTGPLGQGIANAVGMALSERMLAERYNVGDHEVVGHFTYVMASDGDLMEGVQSEAASLAGHLGLGKLIVFYDDNKITIDGEIDLSFSENVGQRFEAYGWQVLSIDDVDNLDAIDEAVEAAKIDHERPTLVVTRTHIGIGSPLQDSSRAHGAPLGDDNIRVTKENYGWPADRTFHVPDEIAAVRTEVLENGASDFKEWKRHFDLFEDAHTDLAAEFERRMRGELPEGWDSQLDLLDYSGGDPIATRQVSGAAINALAAHLPELVGGSADLAESNNTDIKGGGSIAAGSYNGRNIHFGIREHAMGAIMNGMLAHGGFRPFGGTFLVFSDYMRPSIRLAALMELPSIYVFTHDSVWLGEDGPTHQPVEHLMSLRAMPNLLTLRPAEANETVEAWRIAMQQDSRPTAMLLTRQKLAPFAYQGSDLERPMVARGAYTLLDSSGEPQLILMGSGSEVQLCLDAAHKIREEDGIRVRVVSFPSWELFADQPTLYKHAVLPPTTTARLAVEAGSTHGWCHWVGEYGRVIGIDRFGASAPGDQAAESLGMNLDNVVAQARDLLSQLGEGSHRV